MLGRCPTFVESCTPWDAHVFGEVPWATKNAEDAVPKFVQGDGPSPYKKHTRSTRQEIDPEQRADAIELQ